MAEPLETEGLPGNISIYPVVAMLPIMPAEPDHLSLRRFVHDLRNGLSAIYNHAQLLEHSLSGRADEEDRETVRAIMESVQDLTKLIAARVDEPEGPA